MNAVLYLRCSDPRQENSVADQRAALTKYAVTAGHTVIREYVDDGISGDSTERRVAFLKMIADAPRGDFSVILCWDQDRFGRFDSVEAGFYLFPLRKAGISLETIAQGRIDWTDLAGRMVYAIQQEGKHSYLRDLSRNVARGMTAGFTAGRWQGGKPPFGYRVEDGRLVVYEPEATYVRDIFQMYLDGTSTRRLAAWLDAQGVKSPTGKAWTQPTVLSALRNELYTGVMVWNRRSSGKYTRVSNGAAMRTEGAHDAIIEPAQFARVAEALSSRQIRTAPNKSRQKYAFSGLLICGSCGHRMYGRDGWKGEVAYVCSHHVLHRQCLPNWVAQSALVTSLRSAMTITDATRAKIIADVEQSLRGRKVDRKPEVKAATIAAKLAKAKARLLEVDRDMIPIVQQQIRELQAALRSVPTKPAIQVDDVMGMVTRYFRDAVQLLNESSPESLNRGLLEMFAEIVVRVECVQSGQRRRFHFAGATAKTKTGITLKLE